MRLRIGQGRAACLTVPAMNLRLCACTLAGVAFSLGHARAAAPAIENGGFELPKVSKRTIEIEGGNPAATDQPTSWSRFILRSGSKDGRMTIGLTDEISRSGLQSLFIDFDHLKGERWSAVLMTTLLPVRPARPYKVSMWARVDRKRPLTLDQRRPQLQIAFEFYQEDEETQVGDTEYRTIRIPGSRGKLVFSSLRWTQAYGIVRAPLGASLMKVTYVWNLPREDGEADGAIYFDDASIEELPLNFPISTPTEILVDESPADPEPDPESAASPEPPVKP
jgi:hypothetical protein